MWPRWHVVLGVGYQAYGNVLSIVLELSLRNESLRNGTVWQTFTLHSWRPFTENSCDKWKDQYMYEMIGIINPSSHSFFIYSTNPYWTQTLCQAPGNPVVKTLVIVLASCLLLLTSGQDGYSVGHKKKKKKSTMILSSVKYTFCL